MSIANALKLPVLHWTINMFDVQKGDISQHWLQKIMLPGVISALMETFWLLVLVASFLAWFPQTLKSAWIWMLSWKVLDFSICLENGKFSLKSAWKWLYGLEKYKHQKVWSVGVLFCTFELRKVARFSNFVIKSPSLLIQWAVFLTVQITKSIFFYMKFFVTVYLIEI